MNLSRKCNSKNFVFENYWTFLWKKTQRINLWFLWQWVKELDFFFNVTQRIPFVKYDSNGTFFLQIWHKELNFFEYDSKIWFFSKKKPLTEFNLFSSNITKELAFISWIWRTELKIFFQICLELNFFFQIRLKHLNTFGKYDSKNWTFYFWLDSKYWILYFEYGSKNWTLFDVTQRIVFQKNDSKNWTLSLK